ncbi:MAG: hypothetical protein GY938_04945 [Ketobacter sp.]|nr:hypothetical protein [Ketobacter sp.]
MASSKATNTHTMQQSMPPIIQYLWQHCPFGAPTDTDLSHFESMIDNNSAGNAILTADKQDLLPYNTEIHWLLSVGTETQNHARSVVQ